MDGKEPEEIDNYHGEKLEIRWECKSTRLFAVDDPSETVRNAIPKIQSTVEDGQGFESFQNVLKLHLESGSSLPLHRETMGKQ